jgi:hypothetical protein
MSTAQKNSVAHRQVQIIKDIGKAELRTVILAKADDWTALYVDGRKVIEDHSLTENEIFEALGIFVEEVWIDDEWLEQTGHNFPPTAAELPH